MAKCAFRHPHRTSPGELSQQILLVSVHAEHHTTDRHGAHWATVGDYLPPDPNCLQNPESAGDYSSSPFSATDGRKCAPLVPWSSLLVPVPVGPSLATTCAPTRLNSCCNAYVNRKGEVKWNLQDLEVPTVEQCVKEDALEVQDIRELGLGWAWFVNDLRAFLPVWQDMELATPSAEEPITQIAGDVPVEPLPVHADATQLEMELQTYERPLAVTPFGVPEHVPDWHDSHAMSAYVPPSQLGHWIRTDLGVRTFQGLGKNAPLQAQVVRRLTQDVHTHQILESLPCELHLQVPLHRRCLPGCGPQTSATRDIQTTFVYRLHPSLLIPCATSRELSPAPFPSGRGGVFLVPFSVLFVSVSFVAVEGVPIFAIYCGWCLRG